MKRIRGALSAILLVVAAVLAIPVVLALFFACATAPRMIDIP